MIPRVDGLSDIDLATPAHVLRNTKQGRTMLVRAGRSTDASVAAYASRPSVKPPSKWDARQFIGWDGEGVTVRGRHRYVMFVNSMGDALIDRKGVETGAAFRLLLDTAEKYPQAVHVIFAGGYDVNMILSRTLTRAAAHVLSDHGSVTMRVDDVRYRITYHPRHTFEIREEVWDDSLQRCRRLRYVCLWDVFGSFQSSFVKACQRTLTDDELADIAHIIDMKGKRSEFTLSDMDEMLVYCRSELRALVALCEHDRDNFYAAGFKASRWDGAGAKASAVLSARGVGAHKRVLDTELKIPVRAAYAGGRIEQYRFGHHDGPIHTVDIRSAYPWAATLLPSLHGGCWDRVGNVGPDSVDEFSLWHVKYRGKRADTLHPFFWRARDGSVCYPQVTEGWYWAPEVWAAQQYAEGKVTIIDGWRFTPTTSERPFAFVPELYDARRHLEASCKGRGWPLKLALNSLYGKCAQQVGGKDGKPPRWHQLEWAGWITSRCRARMFHLARENLSSLVSIQTDGLTFTGSSVSDSVLKASHSSALGSLEVEHFDSGSFVQSGIYWLRDSDGWHEPKVRGVGPDVLRREAFEAMWEAGEFGSVPVAVTRFRGLVTSSISNARWREWCQWVTEGREIAASPSGKRVHLGERCRTCTRPTDRSVGSVNDLPLMTLHDTWPTGGGSKSALHEIAWETNEGRTTANEWWLDTLDAEDSE